MKTNYLLILNHKQHKQHNRNKLIDKAFTNDNLYLELNSSFMFYSFTING